VRATLAGDGDGFGLADDVVARIMAFVQSRSTGHADALARLDALVAGDGAGNAILAEGVRELREVLEVLRALGVPEGNYAVNFSIARGLDYYTGTVYETTLDDYPQIGSICSGGRYENLAGHYTKSKLPGVGISIGLTRLFYQLREAGIVSTADSSVDALVGLVDEARLADSLALAQLLRAGGINTEVQLEPKKLAKQFQYADRAGIRFMVLAGEDEAARGVVSVKDLRRQEQFDVPREELAAALRTELEQQRAMQAG
jgi:histidyl-tRNA synthetase